jgi:hypothetical protein
MGGTGNVEVPASPAGMNVGRMKVTSECEKSESANAGPCKCSGRARLKRGADATEGTPQKETRRTAKPNADVASRTPESKEKPLGCSGTNNL